MVRRRVGILGYGNLGRYLETQIVKDEEWELAFIWNRTKAHLTNVEPKFILNEIKDFRDFKPDIIVEVAHPSITKRYGSFILEYCDYMIGSPTALCDEYVFKNLQESSTLHGLYVPSGAFWGGEDIKKMDDAKQLQSLAVTMRKHPLSLKLEGYLKEKNASVKDEAFTLYRGPARDVCLLAPHNTNTMAVASIAAPNLGFDGVTGCLIADPNLTNYHIVEVEAFGFPKPDGTCFHVHTIRKNPAIVGEVTGQATYSAYFGSLKRAKGKGPGIHLC